MGSSHIYLTGGTFYTPSFEGSFLLPFSDTVEECHSWQLGFMGPRYPTLHPLKVPPNPLSSHPRSLRTQFSFYRFVDLEVLAPRWVHFHPFLKNLASREWFTALKPSSQDLFRPSSDSRENPMCTFTATYRFELKASSFSSFFMKVVKCETTTDLN